MKKSRKHEIKGRFYRKSFLGLPSAMWNDPAITNLNPGMNLPAQKILTAHRADGSGTTYAFTDYLSKVYPQWKTAVGQGKVVPWPVGTGAPGNAGVANIVRTTPYACGYIELAYAYQNNMTYAFVQNADGNAFVEPTIDSVSADAAAAATSLPAPDGDWSKVSIVNQPGSNSYPISTLTYIFAYKDMSQVSGETQDKTQEVVNLLNWIVTDGQQYASSLLYVPLPDAMVKADQNAISEIQFGGSAVPEFGQIATLVLAIAIVSIIAVSAKTGLRLAPKF
ncbi:MAG: phosphate ABC transporter substrate-binding protein PstS [Nitrosotalea sp.]